MKIITSTFALGYLPVVLTQGYLGTQTGQGDYAAYSGFGDPEFIAAHGNKLDAESAMELFPEYIKTEQDYRR